MLGKLNGSIVCRVYVFKRVKITRCITLQEAHAKLQAAEDSFERLELFRRLVSYFLWKCVHLDFVQISNNFH